MSPSGVDGGGIQINASQLLREPVGATRNYAINEPAVIDGSNRASDISGEVRLLRTQRSILVKCRLNTDLELECSRCLTRFRYPVALNYEEEYWPTVDVETGASLPLPDEAGTFTIDGHHIIDLTEAVRQYTLLAVPMKPLCREDCAGLCPACGCNLNIEKCGCSGEAVDPRWSKLTKQS